MSERYTARQRVLDAAAKCVLGDRNASYGPPTQDFDRTAGMWNSLFGHKLKEGAAFRAQDVAAAIICVKLSRAQHSAKEDNWIDIAGYAACGAECEDAGSAEWSVCGPTTLDALKTAFARVAAENAGRDDNPVQRKRPRVYLAGAIEHAKDAVTWRERVTERLALYGLEGVSPADPALEAKLNAADDEDERIDVMREIQKADRALLDSCQAVFVRWDLESARGAGTVSEAERAACAGTPVVIHNALPDFQHPPIWLRANAACVENAEGRAVQRVAEALLASPVTWVDLEGR